jgi:hypothetical protein
MAIVTTQTNAICQSGNPNRPPIAPPLHAHWDSSELLAVRVLPICLILTMIDVEDGNQEAKTSPK